MAEPSRKPQTVRALQEHATAIKLRFLSMYKAANAGHIGCSLSCAEMLTYVALDWMGPKDQLILSKGHAAAGLYATLTEAGLLSEAEMATFYKDGTRLAAHPSPGLAAQSPFATGSLGHGLSIAAGLALGARWRSEAQQQVFCITSDGELNEGSIWEAALFIAQHRLTNLIWLIDRNRIQGFGRTEEVMTLEPLAAKLAAFGMAVQEANGHDFNQLAEARQRAALVKDRPTVLLCHTVKGNGVSFMADTVGSHYLQMNDAQYAQAVAEITAAGLGGGLKNAS